MSDEGGSGKGLTIGCIVGAAIVGILAVLGLIVVGGLLFFRVRAVAVSSPLPAPAASRAVVAVEDAAPEASEDGTDPSGEGAAPVEEAVTLELTGTGDLGTWYTLDGTIYEGDEAFKAAFAEMAAEAAKAGRKLLVRIEVVPNAGIAAEAVEAAGKICLDAGARIAAPEPAGHDKEKSP